MQRVFYIVSTDEGQGWTVSVEDEPPVRFADQQTAIDAAASAAQDLWDRYGLASGVRVVEPGGSERETHAFGDD